MTTPSTPRECSCPCQSDDDCGIEIDCDLLIAGSGLITACDGGRCVTEPGATPEICAGADPSDPELLRCEWATPRETMPFALGDDMQSEWAGIFEDIFEACEAREARASIGIRSSLSAGPAHSNTNPQRIP